MLVFGTKILVPLLSLLSRLKCSAHNPRSQIASKSKHHQKSTTPAHTLTLHTTHHWTHTSTLGLSPIPDPSYALQLRSFPLHKAAHARVKNSFTIEVLDVDFVDLKKFFLTVNYFSMRLTECCMSKNSNFSTM